MREFFQNLSLRLNSENDISDITWALCVSNEFFENIFLGYCFDNTIFQEIDAIEREFSEKSLRPDFLITDTDGKRYLLEVKKYDRNLHKEYKKLKNIEKLALITNYSVGKQDIYNYQKTWHGFIEHLTEAMRDNNGLDIQVINGYLDYLISATNYFKGVTMSLTNLSSLHIFLKTIKVISEESLVNKFSIKEEHIKIKDNCGESWSGIRIKFKKNSNYFNVWFGVSYVDDVYIAIQFFDECSPSIKDKLSRINRDGDFFIKPRKWGNRTEFVLKTAHFKKLTVNEEKANDEQKYKKQESLLKKYFEEVFNKLIPK